MRVIIGAGESNYIDRYNILYYLFLPLRLPMIARMAIKGISNQTVVKKSGE
jgi:hypothetical protein